MAKKPRSSVDNATETSRTDVPSNEKTKATADAELTTGEEMWARRALFGISALTALTSACSGSDFSGGGALSGGGRRPGDSLDAGDGDAGDSDGDANDDSGDSLVLDGDGGSDSDGDDLGGDGNGDSGPIDPENENDLQDCRANNTQTLDPKEHPAAPSDLKPAVRFYGDKATSSMIAFQFDTSKTVKSVTLIMDSGQLIAFHRLTGGDKDGAEYRAIHVDNVFLSKTSKVKFLINADDKNYVHEETIEYFTTFQGKEVKDYGQHSIPAGYTMDKQSVTQFNANHNDFREDPNTTYPLSATQDTGRTLRTADSDTVWSKGDGVKGIVTDIMGNVLFDVGQSDSSDPDWITKYQTFCTYVESGGVFYRTIMKIG